MRYLIDTNIFLWSLDNNKNLKTQIKEILTNPQNQIFVSVVSGWEISIKHRKSRLRLKTTLRKCFEVCGFEILNINLNHILQLDKLPLYHKDPFDRMLVAQAQVEDCVLITSDPKIKKYKVRTLF